MVSDLQKGTGKMHAPPWPWWRILTLVGTGTLGFHLAFASAALAWMVVLLPFALIGLARLPRWRMAFYPAVILGLLCYTPKLEFFWTIFGFGAVALWLVLAIWLGFFSAGLRWLRLRLQLNRVGLIAVAPVLWTALEFFRSELYWLRFAWFTPGMAFDQWPGVLAALGGYGIGFVATLLAVTAWVLPGIRRFEPTTLSTSLPSLEATARATASLVLLLIGFTASAAKTLHLAGAQLEFPSQHAVLETLDRIVAQHPQTELIVLSEYTLDDAPPTAVLDWCREHRRHLILGGKDHQPDRTFYNTAFVVSPDGEIVFQQAKKQPIQFFQDGKPAPSQQLWNSPWGKIGLAVCYDFSYSRIIDELVRQGAQALIIPTMDMVEWGEAQHATHARLGPIRAAEYGLPVVRVCSSGESQIVARNGTVEHSLPFDAQGAIFAGTLTLDQPGSLPPDRWLVRGCLGGTLLLFVVGIFRPLRPKPDTGALLSKPLSAS